jgi:hypothetical protein
MNLNVKQLRYHHRYPLGTDTQDTDGEEQLGKQFMSRNTYIGCNSFNVIFVTSSKRQEGPSFHVPHAVLHLVLLLR